jgi:thiamine biosynthesis lipoprotein
MRVFAARTGAVLLCTLLCAQVRADSRAADPNHLIKRSKSVMGTLVHISIWHDNDKLAAAAINDVFDEFERLDKLMTSWTDDSVVARINATAGTRKWAKVDEETLLVTNKALEVSRLTGGAFDITVGAFHNLWKFGSNKDGTIPSDADVAERAKLIGYKGIKVNKKKKAIRLKNKGMKITLGGIAKGYAVDRAVAILQKADFPDFIIQAGGDLYVSGKKGSRQWIVGIRDPRGDRATPFAITAIQDMTFSTSGDYERSLIKDGVRYHHILDPTTGKPAMKCRSVTVMAKDAITADGLSTALFVMGVDKGMKLVEKLDDVEAVFVDSENQVHTSSGLKDKLRILNPPTDGI